MQRCTAAQGTRNDRTERFGHDPRGTEGLELGEVLVGAPTGLRTAVLVRGKNHPPSHSEAPYVPSSRPEQVLGLTCVIRMIVAAGDVGSTPSVSASFGVMVNPGFTCSQEMSQPHSAQLYAPKHRSMPGSTTVQTGRPTEAKTPSMGPGWLKILLSKRGSMPDQLNGTMAPGNIIQRST